MRISIASNCDLICEIGAKIALFLWNFPAISGEKKPYTALLQCRTFLCRKEWGPQREDFGGGYGFPGFYRVLVSTTGMESFSLRPEKFSKRFSFGGGCVRFSLLCDLALAMDAICDLGRSVLCTFGKWPKKAPNLSQIRSFLRKYREHWVGV